MKQKIINWYEELSTIEQLALDTIIGFVIFFGSAMSIAGMISLIF